MKTYAGSLEKRDVNSVKSMEIMNGSQLRLILRPKSPVKGTATLSIDGDENYLSNCAAG